MIDHQHLQILYTSVGIGILLILGMRKGWIYPALFVGVSVGCLVMMLYYTFTP